MAITIRQAPQTLTPALNEITYVVSSNNTTESNFQYVCDIYLTNDHGAIKFAGQTYLRLKTPPDPIWTSGVFNINRAIENYVTFDAGDVPVGVYYQKSSGSVVQCICKFGEEYGPSSAVVVNAYLTTATTIRIWNASMDWLDFKNYNKSTFVGNTLSTTRRWLTDRPSSGVVGINENAWLYVLKESTTEVLNFSFNGLNSAGATIVSVSYSSAWTALSTAGQYMVFTASGPKNLLVGDIWAGVVRYSIHSTNDSGDQDREKQWYIIDDSCTHHTPYRFHFLNKLGGVDSFTFIKASVTAMEINARDKFKANTTTRLGGGSYGYNKYDQSEVNHYTRLRDKITVNSDWISENDSTWLDRK